MCAATGRRQLWTADSFALVGIAAAVLMIAVLAYTPVEGLVVDDWTYAWSVGHFLQAGELRMPEWSAHYPLAQVLWGILFSRLFGFSFVVLRLSTLVLAVLSSLIRWQEGAQPQPLGVMLTWNELGHSRELIAGDIPLQWVVSQPLGVGSRQ